MDGDPLSLFLPYSFSDQQNCTGGSSVVHVVCFPEQQQVRARIYGTTLLTSYDTFSSRL